MDTLLSKGEQERLLRQSLQQKRKLKKTIVYILIFGIIAGSIYWFYNQAEKRQSVRPGIEYADQGNAHIETVQNPQQYNSNPPTSGAHFPTPAPWGVYTDPRPDEELIHNLEHGGIWLSYKDLEDKELIDQLKDIADDYSIKVIMTPRPQNDSRIAVAAWTRLLKLEEFDKNQITAFLKAYINKGPEQVPY